MNYGRDKIYTDTKEITAANVVAEVDKAYGVNVRNHTAITTLWDYYRGKTAILGKEKEIRPEINHKINENRAYEIVKLSDDNKVLFIIRLNKVYTPHTPTLPVLS